jgi:hypothetical protein
MYSLFFLPAVRVCRGRGRDAPPPPPTVYRTMPSLPASMRYLSFRVSMVQP